MAEAPVRVLIEIAKLVFEWDWSRIEQASFLGLTELQLCGGHFPPPADPSTHL
jgi:hypothetical protein